MINTLAIPANGYVDPCLLFVGSDSTLEWDGG